VRREKENTSFDQMENEKFPENKEFSKTHTTKTLAQSNQTKPIQDFFCYGGGLHRTLQIVLLLRIRRSIVGGRNPRA
jgi:hypothetical protein